MRHDYPYSFTTSNDVRVSIKNLKIFRIITIGMGCRCVFVFSKPTAVLALLSKYHDSLVHLNTGFN